MIGQGQHVGFALTLAQSAHTPQHWCHCTVTIHTAQSLVLDKMTGLSTAQAQYSCWVNNIL